MKRDVMAELAWDPAVKSNEIGVAVKDGVVTLTAHVETFAEEREQFLSQARRLKDPMTVGSGPPRTSPCSG